MNASTTCNGVASLTFEEKEKLYERGRLIAKVANGGWRMIAISSIESATTVQPQCSHICKVPNSQDFGARCLHQVKTEMSDV